MLHQPPAQPQTPIQTAPNAPADDQAIGQMRGRLDAEEESRLARLWRNERNQEARDRLVSANMGLVISVARRYAGGRVPLDELIAEGNLGLLHAVNGFDPDRGSRFGTYAVYWIRQGISRAFASESPRGHLGGRDRRALSELDRAARAHYARTGCAPTDDELATALGWSRGRIAVCRELLHAFLRPASLDQVRSAGGDPAAKGEEAVAAPDPDAAPSELAELLNGVHGFERAALEMRFGLRGQQPHSIDVIARGFNRTRREAKAAIRSALRRMIEAARGAARHGPSIPARRLPHAAAA